MKLLHGDIVTDSGKIIRDKKCANFIMPQDVEGIPGKANFMTGQ